LSTDAARPTSDGQAPTAAPDVPAPASPSRPVAVPRDTTGGALSARLREARARLEPERPSIPAPRTPEGVVPPPVLGHGAGAPAADLLRAVDDLLARLVEVEDDPQDPDRRTLARALELVATGVPDAGWSVDERLEGESLLGASELAGPLHDDAAALLERLDAEERPAPAVEVDAVVTALRVARMVLDLESFARQAR
jgi:hypothetical protein